MHRCHTLSGPLSPSLFAFFSIQFIPLDVCHCHCLCRGGKSSIKNVVFHKMSPNETLFLESTNKIVKDGRLEGARSKFEKLQSCYFVVEIENSSFVQFQVSTGGCLKIVVRCVCDCDQIWDFPGQIDFLHPSFDSDAIFSGAQAVVFVIDSQVSNLLNVRGHQGSRQVV